MNDSPRRRTITESPADGDITRILGVIIAERRRAAGLSQSQLAELLGMANVRNLQRIEWGQVKCYPETLFRIAHLLGTRGWKLVQAAEDQLNSTST